MHKSKRTGGREIVTELIGLGVPKTNPSVKPMHGLQGRIHNNDPIQHGLCLFNSIQAGAIWRMFGFNRNTLHDASTTSNASTTLSGLLSLPILQPTPDLLPLPCKSIINVAEERGKTGLRRGE
ncbi:hypothetical protein VNO78_28779 [Psophocarpus tetragonolobus]|uniref:Uncharacterized protein n=1 Tax=Psophocarpus tetragonolobus TaxID=3891 RepID=A0AAN9RTR7_PSOTE